MASATYPLFVTNVSYATNRKALCRFFAQYDEGRDPVVCKLIRNEKGRFVGRVKLMMPSQRATDELLGLAAAGQLIYQGRTLRLQWWNMSRYEPSASEDWAEQSVGFSVSDDRGKENTDNIESNMKLDSCSISKPASKNCGIAVNDQEEQDQVIPTEKSDEGLSNVQGQGLKSGNCDNACSGDLVRDSKEACRDGQNSFNCDSAFEKLPDDILLMIFDCLPLDDLRSIEQVSQRCEAMAIRKWHALKRLNVSDFRYSMLNPITDQDFAKLLRKTGGDALQVIDMSVGCQLIRNKSIKIIADLCPNLLEFYLVSMSVDNKGIQALSRGCRKLRVVTLNDRNGLIGEEGLWWLFHNCKDLEVVDLDSNHRLKGPCLHVLGNKAKSINLKNCTSLTDVGIRKLQEFCPLITKLDIGTCSSLTDIGFTHLSKCTQITHLDVSGHYSSVSTEGLRKLSHLSALTVLTMSESNSLNDSVMCDIARGCRKLRCVNIAQMPGSWFGCDITSVAVVELARCCPDLASLNLNYCTGVTDVAVLSLAQHSSSLKTLRARKCNIENESLSELVTSCRMLELLDVMHCEKVYKGIVTTARECLTNQPSRNLEMQLGGTWIDEEDAVDIPSNLIIHFDAPSGFRMDDDIDTSSNEGYCVGLDPADGAEEDDYDYSDEFLDYDDPLYMERFEMS